MATAPPSGISEKAMTIRLCATAWVPLRPKWSRSRWVRNTIMPVRGRIKMQTAASDTIARKNRTSANE